MLKTRKVGTVNVIDISGKGTTLSGDLPLMDTLQSLLDAGEKWFVLDLTGVQYIDSTGIGEIVASHMRARNRSGQVKVVLKPKSKAEEIIRTTCLDQVFEVHPTLEEALAGFAGSRGKA